MIQFVANRTIWASFFGDPGTIVHRRRLFSETTLRLFICGEGDGLITLELTSLGIK